MQACVISSSTFKLFHFNNPITVDGYAALFNCTPVDRASDPMMARPKAIHFSWLGPELSSVAWSTGGKLRFCSSTIFVQIEQKWLATATEIVVLTKMVAISTYFVHFGQKW